MNLSDFLQIGPHIGHAPHMAVICSLLLPQTNDAHLYHTALILSPKATMRLDSGNAHRIIRLIGIPVKIHRHAVLCISDTVRLHGSKDRYAHRLLCDPQMFQNPLLILCHSASMASHGRDNKHFRPTVRQHLNHGLYNQLQIADPPASYCQCNPFSFYSRDPRKILHLRGHCPLNIRNMTAVKQPLHPIHPRQLHAV